MRTIVFLTGVLALTFNLPLAASGQTPQRGSTNDLHLAVGRLVSKGEGRTPTGDHKLPTYQLDEVDLPKPMKFQIRGKTHDLTTILRLTITSDSIQGSNTVWIDDAALPRVFGLGANRIGVFIYDRSILRDGAEISVSKGRELVTLPERLRLPKEFSAAIEPIVEEGSSIVAIRSALRIIGSVREPLVQIEMRTGRRFPVRNAALELQIGKRFFQNELGVDPSGHSLTLSLRPKAFAELKDGAEVIAFFNSPDRSGALSKEIWYFGRLNKSMLDR